VFTRPAKKNDSGEFDGHHQGPRRRALWHEQALHRLPCMRQRQTARQKADSQKKRGLTVRFRSSEHFEE